MNNNIRNKFTCVISAWGIRVNEIIVETQETFVNSFWVKKFLNNSCNNEFLLRFTKQVDMRQHRIYIAPP